MEKKPQYSKIVFLFKFEDLYVFPRRQIRLWFDTWVRDKIMILCTVVFFVHYGKNYTYF